MVPLANLVVGPIYPYVSEHYGMYHHLPVVDATIGGWKGKVLLDTGATRSIISQEIVNAIGVTPKENINYVASGVNGRVTMKHQICPTITILQKVCGPLQLLVMRDVPTFKDTSFDALIGCDVLDRIPNLIFNLSKRIVS